MKIIIAIFLVLPLFLGAQEYKKYVDSLLDVKFDNGPGVSALITKDFKIEYQNTIGQRVTSSPIL